MRLTAIALSLVLLAPAQAQAHREAEAHVHGAAELTLVVDGRTLTVELHSPLWNLLGFEHEPESADELKTWRATMATTNEPAKLFRLDAAAGCTLSSKKLGAFDEKIVVPAPHRAGVDGKEEHYHGDIILTYTFSCASIDKLAKIEVVAFSAFPKLTKVEVAFVGSARQTARDLSPNDRVFNVR